MHSWIPTTRSQARPANLEKVIFGFFIVFAATLNFGFFIGEIDNPAHHDIYELFAAVVVNLIATVLQFGDRTQIGAIHLATSLVADLQLPPRRWCRATSSMWDRHRAHPTTMSSIVSLSGRRAVRQRRLGGDPHRRNHHAAALMP